MKPVFLIPAILAAAAVLSGCEEKAPELADDAKNTPKLSREEAQKYQGLVPGNRRSQKSMNQSQ